MKHRREETYEDAGEVEIKKRTAKAVLAVFQEQEPPRERWVPLGQARDPDDLQEGEVLRLWVSEWFAGKLWEDQDEPAKKEKEWLEFPDSVVMRETDKAIQVRVGGHEGLHWMPLTQVAEDSEVRADGDSGVLKISAWIAGEKGLAAKPDGRQQELPGAGGRPAGERQRTAGDEARDVETDYTGSDDIPF
jgi:hypothetical protein